MIAYIERNSKDIHKKKERRKEGKKEETYRTREYAFINTSVHWNLKYNTIYKHSYKKIL